MSSKFQKAFTHRKRIGRDPVGHFETLKKTDVPTLDRLLEGDASLGNVVVRFFLGATDRIPTRALTGVLSACRIAQLLPCEQVQIITTSFAGNRINGICRDQNIAQFSLLAQVGNHAVSHTMPDIAPKLVFAEDSPDIDTDQFREPIAECLKRDSHSASLLKAQGLRRDGDPIAYASTHIAYQDTRLLHPQPLGDQTIVEADTIVSVGGQAERLFHKIRLGARPFVDPDLLVPTIQVITRHNPPPYFMARGGEQALEDAIQTRSIDVTPDDLLARRDMQHFAGILLAGGGSHE